jgi:hypothetical protein
MKVTLGFTLFVVVVGMMMMMLTGRSSLTEAAACDVSNTGANFTRDTTNTTDCEGGSASFILGRAASYAALAATTVTNVGLTVVTGDIGVYAGDQVTGFNPPGVFTGALHAGDTYAQLAQLDLLDAYNLLAGLPCNVELTDTNLGGLVLAPGVYRFASSAALSNVALTLEGTLSPSDAWVFQVGSSLITDPLASVILTRGARSSNVFWQVGSSATLDHDTAFVGSLLAYASVSANDAASLDGRALALNGAVTLINNAFTVPSSSGNSSNCTATATPSCRPTNSPNCTAISTSSCPATQSDHFFELCTQSSCPATHVEKETFKYNDRVMHRMSLLRAAEPRS